MQENADLKGRDAWVEKENRGGTKEWFQEKAEAWKDTGLHQFPLFGKIMLKDPIVISKAIQVTQESAYPLIVETCGLRRRRGVGSKDWFQAKVDTPKNAGHHHLPWFGKIMVEDLSQHVLQMGLPGIQRGLEWIQVSGLVPSAWILPLWPPFWY